MNEIIEAFNKLNQSGKKRLVQSRFENGKFTIFEDKITPDTVIVLVNENNEAVEDPAVFYYLNVPKEQGVRRETKNNNVFYVFPKSALTPIGVMSIDVKDWPLSEMTIRDFAAIMWQRPVSTKKELNDLIKKM